MPILPAARVVVAEKMLTVQRPAILGEMAGEPDISIGPKHRTFLFGLDRSNSPYFLVDIAVANLLSLLFVGYGMGGFPPQKKAPEDKKGSGSAWISMDANRRGRTNSKSFGC
jgi:hypothetical protein